MEKFYTRTTWENSPSTKTPINETNLNNIEGGVSELDERVTNLSNQKSSVDWVQLRKSGTKIAEVTIDGVKKDVFAPNGSGGGGGGTTDYEDLDNKPSINGVSLVGNKTNSDLGIIIPTTLAELEEDTTHRTVTDAQITKWNQGGSGGGGTAETTTYDNTTSGLDAENVQDAIDELSEDLTHKENKIKHFSSMEDYEAHKSEVAIGDRFVIDEATSAPRIKVLWTNPNPNVEFGAQTITLNSDDYDLLIFVYRYSTNANQHLSSIIEKGASTRFFVVASGTSNITLRERIVTYKNDFSYTVGENQNQVASSTRNTSNEYNIPYKIMGIKL